MALIFIVAPVWDILTETIIILDGKDGPKRNPDTAKNGYRPEIGLRNGDNGKDGLPAIPAGSFIGFAYEIINSNLLTISANGADGGRGQNGGNGGLIFFSNSLRYMNI